MDIVNISQLSPNTKKGSEMATLKIRSIFLHVCILMVLECPEFGCVKLQLVNSSTCAVGL